MVLFIRYVVPKIERLVNKKMTSRSHSFFEIWGRITEETPIKNFAHLAKEVDSSKQSVSRKKNVNEFPIEWAFKIARKFDLNTDWLVTGQGPKRLDEPGESQVEKKSIIEEWVRDVMDKEGHDGRIVMELSLQVPEFRDWYKAKKRASGDTEVDLSHVNVA